MYIYASEPFQQVYLGGFHEEGPPIMEQSRNSVQISELSSTNSVRFHGFPTRDLPRGRSKESQVPTTGTREVVENSLSIAQCVRCTS